MEVAVIDGRRVELAPFAEATHALRPSLAGAAPTARKSGRRGS